VDSMDAMTAADNDCGGSWQRTGPRKRFLDMRDVGWAFVFVDPLAVVPLFCAICAGAACVYQMCTLVPVSLPRIRPNQNAAGQASRG
jgi:hypothetical protein